MNFEKAETFFKRRIQEMLLIQAEMFEDEYKMTIQEALKTGKPFKRPKWDDWTIYDPNLYLGWFYKKEWGIDCGNTSLDLYYEDLMADDWEIKND